MRDYTHKGKNWDEFSREVVASAQAENGDIFQEEEAQEQDNP